MPTGQCDGPAEQLPSGRREFVTNQRLDDRRGEGEAGDAAREARGAVEGGRAVPVVADEDGLGKAEGVEPVVEVAGVVVEGVGEVGISGVAHADEIGGEKAAAGLGHTRQDVPSKVGGGGVAVEEDERQTVGVAGLAVVESGVEDGEAGHGGVASLSSRGIQRLRLRTRSTAISTTTRSGGVGGAARWRTV